jgi:hypothetical protein
MLLTASYPVDSDEVRVPAAYTSPLRLRFHRSKAQMNAVSTPPHFFANLFTFGVARARWISHANRALGHRTGFLFAYFLQSFANYGLSRRLNAALRAVGARHSESPFWCFCLTGWPLIGANRRMRRGFSRFNEAWAVQRHTAAAAVSAAVQVP